MPTKEQDGWIKTALNINVPQRAAAVGAPGSARLAGPRPASDRLPDKYTTCDLTELDKDIENTKAFVDDAIKLERAMRVGAVQVKVDLDDPEAAAKQIKGSGFKLSEPEQAKLQAKLDTVNSRAADLEQRFHAVEKAKEDTDAALLELNNLPDKVPEKEGEEDAGFTVGKHVEHGYDLTVSIIGVVRAGMSFGDLFQAVLGSDALKDRAEKLGDQIADAEEKIDKTMIALNAAINVLTAAAAKRAHDGAVQLERALSDFKKEVRLYNEARDAFIELLTTTAAKTKPGRPRPAGGGPDPGNIARTYGAVLVAGNAYEAAKSALITGTLSEQQYKIWMDRLVPPGTLLSEFADAGEPASPRMMSVAGDLIFYQKDGTNFAYRATRQKIESYAGPLGAVRQIHAFAPDVKGILDAWVKAMKGVLG